ncbi:hypothetical protein ACFQS1_35290 [Paractinoplanes rhizophilus]|uniref:Uncharacterized protein n=1 Tax=Paractinoplanes rhizophilus TaxID=1416877 RepID=A0ABW2I2Z7_9ACTN
MRRALTILSTVILATVVLASPARAGTNDSFQVCSQWTNNASCVEFVDYGEGKPGGGKNDDYILIHQYDPYAAYGVWGYAWLDGKYLGAKFNGSGYYAPAVVWDPFPGGNVKGGQYIGLKVCPGTSSGPIHNGQDCQEWSQYSKDG